MGTIQAKKDLKLMIVLFKSYQTLANYIKEDIKNTDFNLNEFSVLEVVYHHKEITVNDIHSKVLVANSSLSYILDKLVKKELIERRQCTDDKRVTYISLTDKGQKVSETIFPPHYDRLKTIFANLTDAEKEQTIQTLKKLSISVGN